MQKKIKFITLLSLIFSFCYSINFEDLIVKLEEKDKSVKTLKAQYTQLINIVDTEETFVLESEFVFLFPDKLKLEVKSPFQQTIVISNSKLYLKNKVDNTIQVVKIKILKEKKRLSQMYHLQANTLYKNMKI